ncbi:helix-turn-helix domain-containing protein [Fulvivirga sp. M361]|uniref:helix-turn-helix domain-containing protein n=1 Tax=Fulvivirga sp. M361 TaxID=2594266 RepID=UPI00117B8686|nr:helix-turn-helix domain-containing protein [Fulvivirga sp. M361]TRX58773.1 helix-turn-helix domain-containing protein [Fulvivirga sp. M361]
MTYSFQGKELSSFFGMSDHYAEDQYEFLAHKGLINIIWNRSSSDRLIYIDAIPHVLKPNQLTTSTYLQRLSFEKGAEALTVFAFNREFYCIQDHDHEVSCNGIIFFGTQETPVITLDDSEQNKFENLYTVFLDEFKTRDTVQGEMLRSLLKRLIIKVTRLAKEQLITKELDDKQIDIIRKFNVYVDVHFREKRHVSDYAEMLFKSPKTISNLFAKYEQRSPLQIIHERIVLEAKRLLIYTDKTVKEIAFELGFDEVGSFHKLFKKVTTLTPQQFKLEIKS